MARYFAQKWRAWPGLLAAVLAACLCLAISPGLAQPPTVPLAPNDVSILFPVPKTPADLAGLIALKDLANNGTLAPGRLWSEADFGRFVAIAKSPAGAVTIGGATSQIKFPPGTEAIDAWFIAGIRIDVGAPGLTPQIIDAFGQIPQIRFIAQPVTIQGGQVVVHDMAAHLIFSFVTQEEQLRPGCTALHPTDMIPFRAALADFAALRDDLAAGKFGPAVTTTGPLDVNPGFGAATHKGFRDALVQILQRNLISPRLTSMAVMGVPAPSPEPWIFLSMVKIKGVGFVPVQSPALDGTQMAQMLQFLSPGKFAALPKPNTNNTNPITCKNALTTKPFPETVRQGVATAEVLAGGTDQRVSDITGIVSDPARSHFFNTDCVSCHTETRLSLKHNGGPIPQIAQAVLPSDDWNVRNFGWGFSFDDGSFEATVTRRAAAETGEVVKAANALLASQ